MQTATRGKANPQTSRKQIIGLLDKICSVSDLAAGLIDQTGEWLWTSPNLAQRLKKAGPVLRRVSEQARQCLSTGRSDLCWVTAQHSTRLPDITEDLIHLTPLPWPWQQFCLATLLSNASAQETPTIPSSILHTLKHQTMTDPLTGLFNRRWFEEICPGLFLPPVQDVSLMLLDLDHFKSINDELGHAIGDQVLRIVGNRLARLVRTDDHVCRYGGEEFLIFLPQTPIEAAGRIATRLCEQLSQPMDCLGPRLLTVSIGVSLLREADSGIGPALGRADKALYLAKSGGRNRVETCI